MTIERILYLHHKYLTGSLRVGEREELRNALGDEKFEKVFLDFAELKWNEPEFDAATIPVGQADLIYNNVIGNARGKEPVKLWPRIAIAAAVTLVFTMGGYFYNNERSSKVQRDAVDFAPGKMGATLTLSNGKKIRLADMASGEIVKQSEIRITKSADGALVYKIEGKNQDRETGTGQIGTNTLATAKGETYVLTLPDKSRVWMNASTTLTYAPELNIGNVRRVKLEGEAYFEVARDKAHPFIVESEGQQVEVLGTHFNINSYRDEPVTQTTLLEGSVAISLSQEPKDKRTLKPGEQAAKSGDKLTIKAVDAEETIAWRNGYFQFDQESLESVMRKLSRWYDVSVSFENKDVKKIKFSGTMSKYAKISQILQKIASVSEIHYVIKGRNISINKKE